MSTTDPTLTDRPDPTLNISTDQSDYAPGSVAVITAENVNAGDTLEFVVTDAAGNAVSDTNQPWDVTGSVGGTLQTT